MSWIPDVLKQQIVDAVVEFLGKQSETLVGQQLGDKIRGLSTHGALRQALSAALERGIARFSQEYIDIDEDLTAEVVAIPDFWDDRTVQHAMLTLVANPGVPRPDAQATIIAHFATLLPGRRNRQRVDRAVSYLLRLVAEEVWAAPGANDIRQLYALQMQRLSTEALQQQIGLLRANLHATTQLSAEMRQTLLQLTDTVERRLLAIPPPQPVPQRPRPAHNLPGRSYSRFVGRAAELQELRRLLHPRSRHFLVTLDGIGGVGKSALALECAYHYRDHDTTLADDERFVAIVWVSAKRTLLTADGIHQRPYTFTTRNDLYHAIATVLEQPAIMQADVAQRHSLVMQALAGQRTLLIVDNLETIDDEALLTFLRELPDPTKAIVTTRHRIDIAYAIRLAGMPETDAHILMAIETARKHVALPVAQANDLYRRTGGIPLAIVWSIGLMSQGHDIAGVLRRLGSGASDIARFCFHESFAAIRGRAPEHLLLALALFESSVERRMLGAVAGFDDDDIGRDDGLVELEQRSLINKAADRFSLLPLTRVFALEMLTQHPDLEQALRERWIRCLTQVAQPYGGPHWQWRDRALLLTEADHLMTLAQWAQHGARADVLLPLVPALLYYYDMVGQWGEFLALGRIGVEQARLLGDHASLIFTQCFLSWVLSHQGKHTEAEQAAREAMTVAQHHADRAWECSSLHAYAQALRRRSAFAEAIACMHQATALLATLPEPQQTLARADVAYERGKLARDQGHWEDARRHLLAAQEVFRLDADPPTFNIEFAWGLLASLGFVEQQLGHVDIARQIYTQCVSLYRTTGGKGDLTTLLIRFATLEAHQGNHTAARQYLQEARYWGEKLGMERELEQANALSTSLAH